MFIMSEDSFWRLDVKSVLDHLQRIRIEEFLSKQNFIIDSLFTAEYIFFIDIFSFPQGFQYGIFLRKSRLIKLTF